MIDGDIFFILCVKQNKYFKYFFPNRGGKTKYTSMLKLIQIKDIVNAVNGFNAPCQTVKKTH